MPVILATQEAEAEELPEPRRQRLQSAKITPCTPAWAMGETPSQKIKNNNKEDMFSLTPASGQLRLLSGVRLPGHELGPEVTH